MNKAKLRTEETFQKYQKLIQAGGLEGQCALCVLPATKMFTFWKIMPNDFPYDNIAKKHDMLVPLRHVTDAELTTDELTEFSHIKASLQNEYDYFLEGTTRNKSIPKHFHLHLIVLKD